MPFKDTAAKVRNGHPKPQVPEAWRLEEPEPPSSDPQQAYFDQDVADSMDDEDQGVSSQNSEEFHRNVAPKKNNLMGVLNLLKDGRSNCEPAEDEDQGHVTSSDAAASDEQLAPISKPWEFDGTNKRKFKLTTKQLRRMFSPRKLSGHNATSSRRSTARASDELTEDFDHEELSSFTSEDNDEWIEEFVQAPERRDSWKAPGSLEEQRLLRVTNDDLQEACLRGDLGLVKRLIAANASVNAPMRPQDAKEFMTLLHVLARKPHMQNCSSIIAEMVRNKANLNVRSSFGTTPLSLACHAKHVEAVEVLLRAKASAEPVDDFGRKAPLYAILPPWDGSLVDNTEENLTVKTVQLLARARTNLDDGGTHAPIVEAVCHHSFAAGDPTELTPQQSRAVWTGTIAFICLCLLVVVIVVIAYAIVQEDKQRCTSHDLQMQVRNSRLKYQHSLAQKELASSAAQEHKLPLVPAVSYVTGPPPMVSGYADVRQMVIPRAASPVYSGRPQAVPYTVSAPPAYSATG